MKKSCLGSIYAAFLSTVISAGFVFAFVVHSALPWPLRLLAGLFAGISMLSVGQVGFLLRQVHKK